MDLNDPALAVLGLDALAVAAMDLDALALVLVVFWVLGMPYQFLNKVFRVSYHAGQYRLHE